MKVKVCGLRDPRNIKNIIELDIDYMGLIFYDRSPRYVSDELAEEIIHASHATKRMGVFVNASFDFIRQKVDSFQLSGVQLHGKESPAFLEKLRSYLPGLMIFKAFSISSSLPDTKEYEDLCDLFLFDTKGINPGGNGYAFDWRLLGGYHGSTPFLLSGGIGPDMAEAIKKFEHPNFHGVDLNSRFELESGIKDVRSLAGFLYEFKYITDESDR